MYKAGIIGLGRIGALLEGDALREKPSSHAGGCTTHEKIKLVAGCDTNLARRKEFGRVWKIKANKVYKTPQELIEKEELDILIVSTQAKYHYEVVKAGYGIKVILCEKPLSLSLRDAHKMVLEAELEGSYLVVNHERRFSSDYIKAKELVEEGGIGKLLGIRGILNTMGERGSLKEGGVLLHDGTHLFDILRYFSDGEAKVLTSALTNDYGGHGLVVMDNGVHCSFAVMSGCKYFSFVINLIGTEGQINIGNGIEEYFVSKESSYYEGFQDLVKVEFPSYTYKPQFYNIYEEVVRYLESGLRVSSSGFDGYKALEMIYGIYYSSLEGVVVHYPMDFEEAGYIDFEDIRRRLKAM